MCKSELPYLHPTIYLIALKTCSLREGIGGPVGSCKTTLLEMLCKAMRDKYDLVTITDDIYTQADQRILTVSGALPAERIMGIETGGSRHVQPEVERPGAPRGCGPESDDQPEDTGRPERRDFFHRNQRHAASQLKYALWKLGRAV